MTSLDNAAARKGKRENREPRFAVSFGEKGTLTCSKTFRAGSLGLSLSQFGCVEVSLDLIK